MTKKQKRDLVVLLSVFLSVKFLLNGIKGNWSLVFLLTENWAGLLGGVIGFYGMTYLKNQQQK